MITHSSVQHTSVYHSRGEISCKPTWNHRWPLSRGFRSQFSMHAPLETPWRTFRQHTEQGMCPYLCSRTWRSESICYSDCRIALCTWNRLETWKRCDQSSHPLCEWWCMRFPTLPTQRYESLKRLNIESQTQEYSYSTTSTSVHNSEESRRALGWSQFSGDAHSRKLESVRRNSPNRIPLLQIRCCWCPIPPHKRLVIHQASISSLSTCAFSH